MIDWFKNLSDSKKCGVGIFICGPIAAFALTSGFDAIGVALVVFTLLLVFTLMRIDFR